MNDRDWIVEIMTEHDTTVYTFASYDTAADFERTAFLGLVNTEKTQIVKICIHEDKEMP